jgi:hypothetical protein
VHGNEADAVPLVEDGESVAIEQRSTPRRDPGRRSPGVLAAGRDTHKQLGVIAGRRVAASEHFPVAYSASIARESDSSSPARSWPAAFHMSVRG